MISIAMCRCGIYYSDLLVVYGAWMEFFGCFRMGIRDGFTPLMTCDDRRRLLHGGKTNMRV